MHQLLFFCENMYAPFVTNQCLHFRSDQYIQEKYKKKIHLVRKSYFYETNSNQNGMKSATVILKVKNY